MDELLSILSKKNNDDIGDGLDLDLEDRDSDSDENHNF